MSSIEKTKCVKRVRGKQDFVGLEFPPLTLTSVIARDQLELRATCPIQDRAQLHGASSSCLRPANGDLRGPSERGHEHRVPASAGQACWLRPLRNQRASVRMSAAVGDFRPIDDGQPVARDRAVASVMPGRPLRASSIGGGIESPRPWGEPGAGVVTSTCSGEMSGSASTAGVAY